LGTNVLGCRLVGSTSHGMGSLSPPLGGPGAEAHR
jgi:hypothetical protein